MSAFHRAWRQNSGLEVCSGSLGVQGAKQVQLTTIFFHVFLQIVLNVIQFFP